MEKIFEPIIKAIRCRGVNREDMLQWIVDARYRDGKDFAEHVCVGNLAVGLFARKEDLDHFVGRKGRLTSHSAQVTKYRGGCHAYCV